jgi:hydroxymethylglutaryl-CoA reductase (NADPH)
MVLKIPIDPVALTEALPFLVCTVGFDKPLRLARAVFGHEHLLLPPGVEAPSGNAPLAVPNFQPHYHHQLKPAPKIITESLSLVYPPIITVATRPYEHPTTTGGLETRRTGLESR